MYVPYNKGSQKCEKVIGDRRTICSLLASNDLTHFENW